MNNGNGSFQGGPDFNGYGGNNGNHKEKKRGYPSYILISLISGVAGAIVFALVSSFISPEEKIEVPMIKTEKSDIKIDASNNPNIPEAVAKKTMESVVGITSKEIRENNNFFFGATKELVEGVGSGIVVSDKGYILTNSHVIANGNAQELKVLFMNGEEKPASVIWYDKYMDLAVIKVEAEGLKAAELGDSDKINIGEPAIAIGNPLGLEFERTVTSGIISGLNRVISVSDENDMEGLIQTDASINSGNSGGPLLNKEGKVIGVNTLKINSVEGMGFAQPINLAKPVIEQIVNTGKFENVYIGVSPMDVLKYQKITGEDFGVEYGVLVMSVQKGSPADEAGLKPGDVILSVNGDKVESVQSWKKLLYKYKPGESISIGIVRNRQAEDVNLTLSGEEEAKSIKEKIGIFLPN